MEKYPGEGKSAGEADNWAEEIIDVFASEYGWTKTYIMGEVYPEEAIALIDVIIQRKRRESGESDKPSPGYMNNKLDKEGFKKLKNKIAGFRTSGIKTNV